MIGYDHLKNGSFYLEWVKDNKYLFEQNSENQWTEYFQMPIVRDNRASNVAIHTEWFNVKVNENTEEKFVKVIDS